MLLINGTPVAVKLPELPQPIARRLRPREVDRSSRPGCRDAQRTCRAVKFVRVKPGPEPVEPSPAVERKWHESRARLELKRQRLVAETANRYDAMTQCVLPPAEPQSRPQAVQGAGTQTDLSPAYLWWLRRMDEVVVKTGRDASTQLSVCEMIDVDAELQRLVESLVPVTLERAAVEVLSRDHVAALRREQADYERKLLADQCELDRLEHVESLRRQRGMRALAKAERANPGHAYRAVHGRALAVHYTAGLCADALARLESADYLQGENRFAAWLRGQFRGYGCRRRRANDRMNAFIGDVIANRPQVYRHAADVRA